MTAPVYIAGHSLGAARAAMYAFSRVSRRLPVDGVYTFGCPRPGNSVLGRALAQVPVWRAIRNRGGAWPNADLFTAVPLDIGWMLDYAQPAPFEDCREPPYGAYNDWGILSWHHIQLYQEGCRKLAPTGSGAPVELVEAVDATADLYGGSNDIPVGRWDWDHEVNGQYWGMRIMPSGARLLIARGTVTPHEWMQDFDVAQVPLANAMVSAGFWAGVGPIEGLLDEAVA